MNLLEHVEQIKDPLNSSEIASALSRRSKPSFLYNLSHFTDVLCCIVVVIFFG